MLILFITKGIIQSKEDELMMHLVKHNVKMFAITEANLIEEDLPHYQIE